MPYNHQQQQQNLGSFGSLSAPNHQPESPSHPTLPPLQSQNGYSQFGNLSFAQPGSQSHTPTTPHTPATSSMSSNSANAFAQHAPQTYPQGSMLPPSYPPSYPPPQSMMYPSSSGGAMPSSTSTASLPTIRPMPPGGVASSVGGLPSIASTAGLNQQAAFVQNDETPTHVVGSQGRRGILPSAPGRPNPPPGASAQTAKSMIPQKDADGKYPCPHCNKTYLHAKHLKRHLLRRTLIPHAAVCMLERADASNRHRR